MKQIFAIIIILLTGLVADGQKDSILGKQFQLTGRIKAEVQRPPDCGIFAWGTVVEFEVIKLSGMKYAKKTIGIIITCPELYENISFVKGQTYQIVFSDKNQDPFEWLVPNINLLKNYDLSFEPYAVSVKTVIDAIQ